MIPTLYDTFQRWSDTGSVYIISDTHFDDADCKLMDPNWIPAEEQIAILKKTCHKTDTLIHLGDVGDPTYMDELRCHKVLVMGNHDQGRSNFEEHFDEVYEGPLFISEKILLSHEPIAGLGFCMNIHGHDHADAFPKDGRHLNLAANVCGYKPQNLGRLIKGGLLSKIGSIHRDTIDRATARKRERGARRFAR